MCKFKQFEAVVVACASCLIGLSAVAEATAPGTSQIPIHVLQASDLPAGWHMSQEASPTPSTGSTSAKLPIAQCLTLPARFTKGVIPDISAPSYTGPGSHLFANEDVAVFRSPSVPQAYITSFRPTTARCAVRMFNETEPERALHARDAPIAVSLLGRGTASYELVRSANPLLPVTTYLISVLIARGRFLATLILTSAGQPFPISTAKDLVARAAARL